MPLGRRVSKDVAEPYEADQRLAADYPARLAAATEAERALRDAQGADTPAPEVRELVVAFDKALTAALAAAEAAERTEMGPKVYSTPAQDAATRRAAEIAYRKAKARPSVRPWTDEVDRLRTAREAHRLSFRTRPAAV
ncbi:MULTISPECIES: plectin [Actinomadura]|uniref:Plectin n=1 Tax=Actinomadura litoris TaxID=2678616 RepID=A0A7K1KYI5_9ACTN|nr:MULTISPECIES: plectin [Actinomadura]MBT2212228.1 plectin [Actinomadura sp. NEAU-AAG7]MUN37280.1 plectin [Actinomadura litoris]